MHYVKNGTTPRIPPYSSVQYNNLKKRVGKLLYSRLRESRMDNAAREVRSAWLGTE
jgi:hypothetical protein